MSPDDCIMLSKQLDKGFATTHKRIDALREDFKECQGRQGIIFGKIAEVEKQQAVDHALDGREEKQEGKVWDIWKLVIRTAIVCSVPILAGVLGILIWLSQNIKTP